MDDIETRLEKGKRGGDKIDAEITPIKNRKIVLLYDEPEMNIDEGKTIIYETVPTLQEVLSTLEGRNRTSFYINKNFTVKLVKL